MKIYRRIRARAAAALFIIANVAFGAAGCATPSRTDATIHSKEVVIVIRIRLPRSLRLFAQHALAALPYNAHVGRGNLYDFANDEIVIDFNITDLKNKTVKKQLSSIIKVEKSGNYEIYRAYLTARDLEAILKISFIPPADAQLSREEIVEYYRWTLGDYIDPNGVEAFLRRMSVSLIINPNEDVNGNNESDSRDKLSETINILDFIIGGGQISAEYRKRIS